MLDPEKKEVTLDLEPVINHAYNILESSVENAIDHFKQKKRPVNLHTLPDLIRDEAKYFLEQSPLNNTLYVLEDLARNGLSLICKGNYYQVYHIKILKSEQDKLLPITGMSNIREHFYCQLPIKFVFIRTPLSNNKEVLSNVPLNDTNKRILNLVLHWNVNLENGTLSLILSCPKHASTNQAMIYWEKQIEHPAITIAAKEPVVAAYDEDIDDLGISLPNKGELENRQ